MNQAAINQLRERGISLQWSAQREGVEWIKQGLWLIIVQDPEGGYWSVGPERNVDGLGRKDGPDGALLDKDEPFQLALVLEEAGLKDVQLYKLERKPTGPAPFRCPGCLHFQHVKGPCDVCRTLVIPRDSDE